MKYADVKAAWNAQADECNDWTTLGDDEMTAFTIALVASAERERCAKLFDSSPNAEMFRQDIAAAIRALKGGDECS